MAARFASFVKLPHTFFALPFAGVGAILASHRYLGNVSFAALVWIVVAFTAARFAAMGFNRIADREHDALNPRTAQRELPAGRLTLPQAAGAVVLAAAFFVFAAWQVNPLCGWLSPVALAWILGYSFTKRFTGLAHHVLGLSLGIAPVGAYLAIAGQWAAPWFALPVVAAAVMFWVAGFDTIYAVQDLEFDRRHGLHSIPARHGAPAALALARTFHALAFLLFASLRWLFPVGELYLLGVLVGAGLLVYQHAVVRGIDPADLDLPRIDRAFFHANVGVSTTIFVATLLDRLLPLHQLPS
ncbi:MAG: 4-hydroxybenzoate octaprenyltransferase [Gemmatimonadetes bacterium]|nr:4-hydroxybenzoate octaprenyltransferase [Gemmatimonadota bacterium]